MVGSQARILYSDQEGRIAIALAFNKAVAEKKLKACALDTEFNTELHVHRYLHFIIELPLLTKLLNDVGTGCDQS